MSDFTDERLRAAYAASTADTPHPDEAAWERLMTGEAAERERDELLAHALSCRECALVQKALLGLRREAASFDPEVPAPRRSGGTPALPWLALAAGLVVGVAGGALWPARPAPETAPVMRSSAAGDALPVETVADLQPGANATLRRSVTLLSCPAPEVQGGDRIDAALVEPTGGSFWDARDVARSDGRVRVVADLREADAGAWTLELRRADLAGRVLETRRCEFEIR
jgi:hypothetical protein